MVLEGDGSQTDAPLVSLDLESLRVKCLEKMSLTTLLTSLIQSITHLSCSIPSSESKSTNHV